MTDGQTNLVVQTLLRRKKLAVTEKVMFINFENIFSPKWFVTIIMHQAEKWQVL